MDLTRLTLAELDEAAARLGVLADAAEALDTCGSAPVITITDRETVIRAGAILGRRDGHAPLIEDDADRTPPPDLMAWVAREPGDGGQPGPRPVRARRAGDRTRRAATLRTPAHRALRRRRMRKTSCRA